MNAMGNADKSLDPRQTNDMPTWTSLPRRYWEFYMYGTTYNDLTAYNRALIGDATGEITIYNGAAKANYNDDYTRFVCLYRGSEWCPTFIRGGNYTNAALAGVFASGNNTGGTNANNAFRPVLLFV